MVFTKVSVFVLDNFERSLCDGFRPFHTAVPAEIAICNKKLLNNFGEMLFRVFKYFFLEMDCLKWK